MMAKLYECTTCGEYKSWDDFPKHKRYRDGITKTCWECHRPKHREYIRRYQKTEKGKAKIRASKLKTRYGISEEQYAEMLIRQGGGCAICKKPPVKKVLGVDHDHKNGRVRGLLCDACNQGIGRFEDRPALLLRAIEYLRSN